MPEHLKVLITVKTLPIPSSKYDELVCTAGVTEAGDFVRLYPITLVSGYFPKKSYNLRVNSKMRTALSGTI